MSEGNREMLLKTRGLTKQFGKHVAVDRVDMHIRRGAIYGFIGRNGAGKTTVLKMIAGLADPTAGEYEIFGCSGKSLAKVRSRVGCLIEQPGLYPNMSAQDNLMIKAELFGIRDKKYAEELLGLVGLVHAGRKKTKHFSLGMKQRLGIALALVGNPDFLVLDEPINGLDPQGIVEIRDMLQRLSEERNITILISSHILEELSKLCTDFGIIHNGVLLQEISQEQLIQQCSKRLELTLDQPEQAMPILDRLGITRYEMIDVNHLYLYERLEDSAQINAQLVEAGVFPRELRIYQEELERFLKLAANVSKKHPVVVSQFIEHAKEVEMDAVAQNGEIVAYAISEHIEFAGVHSGDATIQFPPQKLYVETVRRIKRISREIAKALNISGPFNIQYLAKDNDIKVIECNLRASRSFPFVSKVLKINFIELATKVMLGLPVEKPEKNLFELDYVGIKASQFSFNRLQKADPVLGVDMASTGEVGCIGMDTSCAVLKAMLSVGYRIPQKNILLSTGTMKQKADMMDAARMLVNKGYKLFATGGTHKTLAENGIESTHVYWPSEEGHPQALEMLHRKEIDMVVNIPKNLTAGELSNGYKIRRAAIDLNIPLITNARLASAFINAFCTMSVDDIAIKSWAEYK